MIFLLNNPDETDDKINSLLGVELTIYNNKVYIYRPTFVCGALTFLLAHKEVDMEVFRDDFSALSAEIDKYRKEVLDKKFPADTLMEVVTDYINEHIPAVREILKPFAEKYGLDLVEDFESSAE